MSLKEKLEKKQEVAKQSGGMTLKGFLNGEVKDEMEKQCGTELASKILSSFCASFNDPKLVKLMSCTPKTIKNALVKVSALGLVPNTPLGYAHLIPYGDECTVQLGYQGIVELCRREGVVCFAEVVREGDIFEYSKGRNKNIEHKPSKSGKVIGIYAGWEVKATDEWDFEYWTIEEVVAHAKKYSKSFNNTDGAWKNVVDTEVCPINIWMAKKTVLRTALKLAPKSLVVAKAIVEDEAVDGTWNKDVLHPVVVDVEANEPTEVNNDTAV